MAHSMLMPGLEVCCYVLPVSVAVLAVLRKTGVGGGGAVAVPVAGLTKRFLITSKKIS